MTPPPAGAARVAGCVVFWLLVAPLAFAQQSPVRGNLEGTVTDSNLLPVAGAAVQVLSAGTGESRAATTDSQGVFRFTGLRVGDYELRADAAGFSRYTQTGIVLAVGQTGHVAIQLKPAGVQTQITVSAPVSPLDVTQTSVTSAIDHERIEELPVQTRNALDFVLLAAGVTPAGAQSGTGLQIPLAASGFSFGGLRPRSNNIAIDGLDNNDEYTGDSRTELSPEIVSEFQVVNNGISAEFGGASGGSINVVTRSGTNQPHGDAFLFVQNGVWNARPALEQEQRKPDLTRYRAGLSNGGAIRKNRTFYYAAFEQEHNRSQEETLIDPSVAGAVDQALAAGAYRGVATKTLHPGLVPTARAETELSAKLDHQLNTANGLTVRYAFTNNREAGDAFNAGGLSDPSAAGSAFLRDHALAGSLLSTLSPVSVNDVRFQVARRSAALRTTDAMGPYLDIAGLLGFGRPYEGNSTRVEDHYEGSDTFSRSVGSHLLKAGAVVNHVHLDSLAPDGFGAVYLFPSVAAFQAGQPDFFLQTFGKPGTHYGVTNYGGFFQDHWSVSRKFTLDVGVRYDFEQLPGRFRPDTNNVSPRVGAAFSPTHRWVLRAGFGLFYDRYTLANLNRAMEIDGRQAFQQVADGATAALLFGQSRGGALAAPNPALAPSMYRADARLATPYSLQASFGIERQLGAHATVGLSYQFVRGVKLPRTRNINLAGPFFPAPDGELAGPGSISRPTGHPVFGLARLNPAWNGVYQLEDAASSAYHAFTATLNRRLAQEFEFSANYTFSKAIDDASDFDEQPQNPYDLSAERGLSRVSQKHRLVFNGTFELPIGEDRADRHLAARIFRNVELAPILVVQSGRPVNPLTGLDSDRAQAWPLAARPAGFGRNTLQTPATASVELRVLKFFPVGEHARIDLVAESFNLLNRTNVTGINPFFGPDRTPLARFRTPFAAATARHIQFSLDFEY